MTTSIDNHDPLTYRHAHDATFQASTKKQKLLDYAKWAPGYDEHAKRGRYIAHEKCVQQLWPCLTSYPTSTHIRILDAGCGTGLCGVHIRNKQHELQTGIKLIGADFSEDMIVRAKARDLYDELLLADLSVPVQLNGGQVDFLVAAGLFLEGHFEPKHVGVLMQMVKDGGYASISFRCSVYSKDREGYERSFEEANCDVVENSVMTYARDGEILGNYVLLRKRPAKQ